MRFPYDTYVVDTSKALVRISGQLNIEGGVLAAVAPNGEMLRVWANGHWRSVEAAVEDQ